MPKHEFTISDQYHYNRSGPVQWVISHGMRYAYLPLAMILCMILANALMSYSRILVGDVFRWVEAPVATLDGLLRLAVMVGLTRLAQGVLGIGSNIANEFLAQRIERDARDELYVSLLGKSLTFHGRQRVGDLMARATNDVRQLNFMMSPGVSLIFDSAMGIVLPLVAIATIRVELLLVPTLFVIGLVFLLKDYTKRLNPVSDAMREQFGQMNAGLEESLSGIEVVKVNAQEAQEKQKFVKEAVSFRNMFVQRGEIQAKYWPFLVYGTGYAMALLHALLLYRRGVGFDLGDIVAFMGLFQLLQFPTFLSLFSFTIVQMGISGAGRILDIITTETELDINAEGERHEMRGEVEFRDVTFGYEDGSTVLEGISFCAKPGETIAIVGGTGSGKSTLTRLINRVYDADQGTVLVDGVDVRDWSMESLRSQMAAIEQDVFLFSRPIAENIAFGVGQQATQDEIEQAARQAQAHEFITSFAEGYDSEVGERGVTLSGGQRQRIAIARAFLVNPRILVLDDSTSAIDSATEDEIQKAMYRVQEGRTTFLITHRLSQIRWADRILVLRQGRLVDQGTHEALLERCREYRRIFSRYEAA